MQLSIRSSLLSLAGPFTLALSVLLALPVPASPLGLVPPALGNYPAATALLSTDTIVTPDATPSDTTSINVFTSTNFRGTLEGDPVTGIVRITNAHPAGIYTVTVKAFGSGGSSAIRTFSLTVSTPVTCLPVNFATASTFLIGGYDPDSVAIGDFNGDGKQDLAVANDGSSNVSIFLGNGGGVFSPAVKVSAGPRPRSVVVGDFNGDGKQDLVVANRDAQYVSVLLGDGSGSFGPAASFTAGNHPQAVAAGDFNGDGKQDLAVANALSENVSVLLGDGTGSFSPPTHFSAGTTSVSIAVSDFNGDGKHDLAVANFDSDNVSILLGDGTGSFGPTTNFSVGDSPASIAVGDFNGDNQPDLAVVNTGSNYLSILLGNGAGNFSPAPNVVGSSPPSSVTLGDFNGDGKQDLAETTENSNNVSILLGDGSGSFTSGPSFAASTNPVSAAVGDFNHDGKQDLAVINYVARSVSIRMRDCFAPPTPTPSPAPTPSLIPAQALNIATRLRVEIGERVMIGGFIITGSAPKKVAIRGIGPSLANVGLSDLLADPTLELRGSGGALLVQNDNWQEDPAQAAQLTGLGLALADSRESGIVATLEPGAYTAVIAGKNQTSGLALVEVYDADPAADSRLANISTRGFVQAGDDVMIGGFILGQGNGSTSVAVRGLGPSLSQLGLDNVLADPTLELRDANGVLLVANDNWQDDPASAALTAQGLAPQDPLEPGIFATVPPGLFTAILAGKNGGVGIGLLEIYGNVHPPTIVVTNRFSSGPGTLRQALLDVPNGGAIQFDPTLYGMTVNQSSVLVIDKNIVVRGPGPDQLTVQLSGRFSVIEITSGHTVVLEGVTIRGGQTRQVGGGIRNEGATVTLNHCVVRGNAADSRGGGIYNRTDGRLTLLNSTVTQNWATGDFPASSAGGIDNSGTMEIRNSTVSENVASPGTVAPGLAAGIYNSGSLTITNSTIRDNSVAGAGAGIVNHGPLTITNCTISGNTASPGGLPGYLSNGGGITHNGDSPLTITNSTISGNSVPDRGGAIYANGPLTITNSTINNNSEDVSSGDIDNSGSLQIANTILRAGSSGATLFSPSATVTSLGYNLSSDNGGGFLTATGDQINTNPMLGQLRNNGGPTFTHELLSGSPAIDAGTPDSTPAPAYDQRGPGYPRVINGQIDIGSFEVQPAATPTPTPEPRR